jgi:periplasmic divalent cation tolerance protein
MRVSAFSSKQARTKGCESEARLSEEGDQQTARDSSRAVRISGLPLRFHAGNLSLCFHALEWSGAMQTEFVFIYSTFPDEASARRVAEALVDARIAACVNIHSPITSVYEWQGKIEVQREYAAFIKTRRENVDQAIGLACPLHPYTVPCFLVLPIDTGNDEYLDWVRAQTISAGTVTLTKSEPGPL